VRNQHKKRAKSGIVAWLITWEWIGDHAKVENKIATILNYRLSADSVREIMEQIYIDHYTSLPERVAYAKDKKNHPYPAQSARVDGVPWSGRIYCGRNPYLYARLVDDLHADVDKSGEETLTWKECPKPKLSPEIIEMWKGLKR
jgi:hypothetical protein